MKKCNQCRKKVYGYTDGTHEVWVCWACGAFEGTGTDPFFPQIVTANPLLVLAMIAEKKLQPIKSGK